MRLIKTVSMMMCLLAFEAQAFDVIKVDQAVKKLFQSFFDDEKESTYCNVNYSYESIRYAADRDGYPSEFFEEHPELKQKYLLPDDIEVKIDEVDFCTWSDGYWITLRYTGGNYKVIDYTSFSQPE
ncbi:MAG: hypothetical protein OXD47_04305 [Gammaproteobacteria bacterium]|nr:hypothetical protein [Gammaproteobacteria bacterium]